MASSGVRNSRDISLPVSLKIGLGLLSYKLRIFHRWAAKAAYQHSFIQVSVIAVYIDELSIEDPEVSTWFTKKVDNLNGTYYHGSVVRTDYNKWIDSVV
jgi:hypothetical protein